MYKLIKHLANTKQFKLTGKYTKVICFFNNHGDIANKLHHSCEKVSINIRFNCLLSDLGITFNEVINPRHYQPSYISCL